MKILPVIEQVACGAATLGIAAAVVLLTYNWIDARNGLASATYALAQRDTTIALKDKTLAAYERAAASYQESSDSWKQRYEQLRWQLRTKPTTDRR
jgi:hypothetical protein